LALNALAITATSGAIMIAKPSTAMIRTVAFIMWGHHAGALVVRGRQASTWTTRATPSTAGTTYSPLAGIPRGQRRRRTPVPRPG
jgi:hypothetical protein